jgi:hypothetical protein
VDNVDFASVGVGVATPAHNGLDGHHPARLHRELSNRSLRLYLTTDKSMTALTKGWLDSGRLVADVVFATGVPDVTFDLGDMPLARDFDCLYE